jgi:hypothetical protein
VQESARVNSINQYTPYGSVVYQKDGTGVPTSVTTSLTPLQQQALDQQNKLATILGSSAINQSQFLPQDKFSLDSLGARPSETDYGAQAQQVRDATYNQAMGLLRPDFESRSRSMEQQVADRGLPVAGEAAQLLRDQEGRRQDQAMQQAAFQAVQAGGNEQSRLFNIGMSARQQGVSELQTERNQPYNELAAYLQGTPMQNAPQASTPSYQVAPADVAGNIYKNFDTQNQRYLANLNGMYQLGGTAAQAAVAASDRRLKTNIKKLGKAKGYNWYEYNYVWGGPKQIGVMAQEIIKTKPSAVITLSNGYMMVDYGKLI